MGDHELFYTDYRIAGAQLSCRYEQEKLVLISVEASPCNFRQGNGPR